MAAARADSLRPLSSRGVGGDGEGFAGVAPICPTTIAAPWRWRRILLAGCAAVGMPRRAPFVEPGRTGELVERLEASSLSAAVAWCLRLDRRAVAAAAAERFDAARIVATIAGARETILG